MNVRNAATRFGAVLLAVTLCLTGCASEQSAPVPTVVTIAPSIGAKDANGIEKLSSAKLIDAVLNAVRKAGAVHMTGNYTQPTPVDEVGKPVVDPANPPRSLTMDLTGTSTKFEATFTSGSLSAEMKRLDDDVYLTGNQAFAAQLGDVRASAGFVKFSADDSRLVPWLAMTDPGAVLGSVLDDTRDGVAYAIGSTSADPTPNVQLEVSVNNAMAGTVTISTVGAPVPLGFAIVDPTGEGDFSFDAWGKKVTVKAPEDYVEA